MVKKRYFIIVLLMTLLFSGCGSPDIAVFSEPLNETFDIEHNQLKVINTEIEQEKVHDGKAYRFWDSFTVNANSNRFLRIEVGENALHFKERDFVVSNNDAEVYYKVYIDNDATGGTLRDNIYNSNTYYNISDNTQIYLDPTITSLGAQTDQLMIPDTNRAGSSSSDAFEWIYKANTTLIVEIENNGNQQIDVNLRYKWYINGDY